MSLSLHNTLRVVLCPDKVILLGRRKGFKQNIQLQTSLACESMQEGAGWQAALGTLKSWLHEHPQPRSRVSFILSNRFVRYALIPWSDEVKSAQEEQGLAQAVFADIYGNMCSEWSIAVAGTGYQQPLLAAAIDAGLCSSIRQLCVGTGLILESIQPWLTVAYSHFRPQIETTTSGLFAIEESGQLVTLALQNKEMVSVRKEPVAGAEHLGDCLQRELIYCGFAKAVPIRVHNQSGNTQALSATGMKVDFLRVSDGQPDFDMALTRGYPQSLILNFHPRRFAGSRSGIVLLTASLVLAAFLSYFYATAFREHQRIQTEVTRISAAKRLSRDQVSDPQIAETWKRATAVIEQLSFPWNRLFFTLESATVDDVVLLAVQPDLQTGVITLSGEARNWHAMVQYLRRLKDDRFFTSVQLANHQIQQNDPQKPVHFILLCTWREISG